MLWPLLPLPVLLLLLLLLLLQVLQPDDVFPSMSALLDSRPDLRCVSRHTFACLLPYSR
jgi:hypothetical protein